MSQEERDELNWLKRARGTIMFLMEEYGRTSVPMPRAVSLLAFPRELPPEAYKFFGRETQQKQLIDRLRAGLNTAVVGPAGLGKTALAASALRDVVGQNADNLRGSRFRKGSRISISILFRANSNRRGTRWQVGSAGWSSWNGGPLANGRRKRVAPGGFW
jgi:hypothetical protein